jgi:hypothetical protein
MSQEDEDMNTLVAMIDRIGVTEVLSNIAEYYLCQQRPMDTKIGRMIQRTEKEVEREYDQFWAKYDSK